MVSLSSDNDIILLLILSMSRNNAFMESDKEPNLLSFVSTSSDVISMSLDVALFESNTENKAF